MANENVFSGKAQFYNSRPTYSNECIDYLIRTFGLNSESVIADIGAGTGILTKPFLEIGATVYAVEPNEDMFGELNRNLSHYETLRAVQAFDEKRYIHHWLSSATAPLPNDAIFDEYINKCKSIFNKYFPNGIADLPFAVNCFIGQL